MKVTVNGQTATISLGANGDVAIHGWHFERTGNDPEMTPQQLVRFLGEHLLRVSVTEGGEPLRADGAWDYQTGEGWTPAESDEGRT